MFIGHVVQVPEQIEYAQRFGQHRHSAGLKGSIPLALVLGLPLEPLKPLREFLVPVAFGVVLVSLLLQGLTIPALIKAVDVGEDEAEPDEQTD